MGACPALGPRPQGCRALGGQDSNGAGDSCPGRRRAPTPRAPGTPGSSPAACPRALRAARPGPARRCAEPRGRAGKARPGVDVLSVNRGLCRGTRRLRESGPARARGEAGPGGRARRAGRSAPSRLSGPAVTPPRLPNPLQPSRFTADLCHQRINHCQPAASAGAARAGRPGHAGPWAG